MKFPHVLDYYSGDDSIMDISTKLCIVEREEFVRKVWTNAYYT